MPFSVPGPINYMHTLTPDERRQHTIPGRRAHQFRAAERQVRRIADVPLLTREQRERLAAILLGHG